MFTQLALEAMRLLDDHRKEYHVKSKDHCVICRSLRRAILKGVQK